MMVPPLNWISRSTPKINDDRIDTAIRMMEMVKNIFLFAIKSNSFFISNTSVKLGISQALES